MHQDVAINRAIETVSRAFASWENPTYPREMRIKNLGAVLRSAADLGFLLFSQRAMLEWYWTLPQGSAAAPISQQIVLFPALVKTADESGQRVSPTQLLLEMDVAPIH